MVYVIFIAKKVKLTIKYEVSHIKFLGGYIKLIHT